MPDLSLNSLERSATACATIEDEDDDEYENDAFRKQLYFPFPFQPANASSSLPRFGPVAPQFG
jgi:hypothetical protein